MKTFKVAVLIPHGNIQFKLIQEQKLFCSQTKIVKATPFLCILEKFEKDIQVELILSKYLKLFQSLTCIPELLPIKIENSRAFRRLNEEVSSLLTDKSFLLGSFLYRIGEFLYGTSKINSQSDFQIQDEDNFKNLSKNIPSTNERIKCRIFQIAVFTINENENCVTWHIEAAKWVRSNQPVLHKD
ncbi:MAG: hypothetical protein GX297_01530 [Treponema sp.]|nr:hypothetical protein [Treponema sp.]